MGRQRRKKGCNEGVKGGEKRKKGVREREKGGEGEDERD